MIDITEKVKDYFQLEAVVTKHSNNISCNQCINCLKCQDKRTKPNTLACRDELRDTYRENRYEGLVVTIERAADWNVKPTEYEQMMYEAFVNLQKELSESCVA